MKLLICKKNNKKYTIINLVFKSKITNITFKKVEIDFFCSYIFRTLLNMGRKNL